MGATTTTIGSNAEQNQHLITFGMPEGDYILAVSRADGGELGEDFADHITMWNDGAKYPLNFYQNPNLIAGLEMGESLTDDEKQQLENAAANANVNIVGNVAYIAVPKSQQTNPVFLMEFSDDSAYDVAAIYAAPTAKIDSAAAAVNSNNIDVSWTGTAISDTAKVSVSVSDEKDTDGVILAENLPANTLSAVVAIPDTLASGEYYVTVILSDEEKAYQTYQIQTPITITDSKAPTKPLSVSIANQGNNKLSVTITDDFAKDKLEGYYVDIYEDGTLIEAAVYYSKEQAQSDEILIGGRYDVPVMNDDGTQATDGEGNGLYRTLGFTPEKNYSVKVRAGSSETNADGAAVYHYSGFVTSTPVALRGATPPTISLEVNGGTNFELSKNVNTFVFTASEAVKGTFTVNGADGTTYHFDSEYKTVWEQELALDDGVYTLEFAATDADGDNSLTQVIVSVDTTAPNLMLESPVNGDTFADNKIKIRGVADSDALYTFKVDGTVIGAADRDMSAHIVNGILDYTIDLDGTASSHTVEIIAKDTAGNITSRLATVTDNSMPDIKRVEVWNNGSSVPSSGLKLGADGTAQLTLMGITSDGGSIDVTEAENTSFTMVSGSGVALGGSTVSANGEGQGIVMASLDLGGGFALTDAILVVSGEEILYDGLDNAISDAEELKESDYTTESWTIVKEALSAGKVIRQTGVNNQEIVNNAATAIADAIAGLVKKSSSSSGGSGGISSYTVTFNANGGSNVKSLRINRNGKATKPDDPSKAGFSFTGWYGDKELNKPYDFEKPVTSSFTLYAGWKKLPSKWENPFIDAAESDWFYGDVEYACVNGLFNGTSENTFSPNNVMTRAMLVTVLWRMKESPSVNSTPFIDVVSGQYYFQAVAWAEANGIVSGIGGSMFAPDAEITREQMAAILYRYSTSPELTAYQLEFADADMVSDWAFDAMVWAATEGIISGKPGELLDPQGSATRAEVAAMLRRYMESVK